MTLKLGTFKVKATDKGHDGTTHQGLSTSEVWKSYWPWCRYNEVKCQLHIWPWNLELSRSRSQTKVPMERTHQGLHLKCLRVLDNGLGTMKFNPKNIFDLEIWNLQGHRQRSQWVELTKVYLHVSLKEVLSMVILQQWI